MTRRLPQGAGAGGHNYLQGSVSLSKVFQSMLAQPPDEAGAANANVGDTPPEAVNEQDPQTLNESEITLDDVIDSVNHSTPVRTPALANQPMAPAPHFTMSEYFGREILERLDRHLAHSDRMFERVTETQNILATGKIFTGTISGK